MALLLIYTYFTLSEYITIGYKAELGNKELLAQLMLGKSAFWFWSFIIGGLIIPAFLIVFKKINIITRVVIASILINVTMWIKRFVIVIGTLQVPMMPFEFGTYKPTWVEISITLAAIAGFVLLFAIFTKVFPIISIWEVSEEHKKKLSQEKPSQEYVPAENTHQISEDLRRRDN